MKCLFWPLLDIISSLVAPIFMLNTSVLARIPDTTALTVIAGVFEVMRAVCYIADRP